MTSLTPIVRQILFIWIGVWLASVIAHLLSVPIGIFAFHPHWALAGELKASIGLFSYPFFHDPGGFLHLFFNGWIFAFFAPEIERLYPGRKFCIFLGLTSLLGAFAHLLLTYFNPGLGFPIWGGSGLAMAALGAFVAHFPRATFNLFFFQPRVWVVFGVICALDALTLIASLAGKTSAISSDVHLMGAVCGWLWGRGFQSQWQFPGRQSLHQWKVGKVKRRDEASAFELDRILAKISQKGIGSLTAREKSFLEKQSKKGR